ncbi:MAG: Asp-tRNA(Asn)/Glu-tRNA(Gln) amidotransferase subunit GatA [Planctomycetes bacterium]|nr:Asp-tRNA(Asn)/Glu-tRNA(Gln) amidotransferase subunit GatA [Planctomycetota bacterium]
MTTTTAAGLAKAIKEKQTTSREAVAAYLGRIESHDGKIGAFLNTYPEEALKNAEEVDARIAKGEATGPLAGVPVAVKDNICIKGKTATCSSKMLAEVAPPYDSHVAEQLRKAGAIVIGKTNLDEFAMGSSTENSAMKLTRNPWDTQRIPGGSSGGSAAAVAAGFAPLALGSDTGASTRQPASLCGCVGFKPTYGMVSRWGLIAFGSSLDQIGPFARTVEDAALLMNAISGPDRRDSTCTKNAAPDFTANLKDGINGMKIGVPTEYFNTDGLDSEVRAKVMEAIETMKAEGAEIVEISLPMLEYAVPTYYIIATAEASSNLARFDGVHYGHRAEEPGNIIDLFSKSREEGFGAEVKRRIMLGTYVLSAGYYDAYYLRALRVRQRIADDFSSAFKKVDVIAAPVSPCTAFKVGEKSQDPLAMYLSDIYTISANLAAIPAISVPCGSSSQGLPIGLQLMGERFRDADLLKAAYAYEQATGTIPQIAPLG